MDWLMPGKKVKLKKDFGVLLFACKAHDGSWGVLIKPKKDSSVHTISCVPAHEIKAYTSHCWNKDCENHSIPNSIDSTTHETCPKCHWVICPSCSACKQGGCTDDQIRIIVPGE